MKNKIYDKWKRQNLDLCKLAINFLMEATKPTLEAATMEIRRNNEFVLQMKEKIIVTTQPHFSYWFIFAETKFCFCSSNYALVNIFHVRDFRCMFSFMITLDYIILYVNQWNYAQYYWVIVLRFNSMLWMDMSLIIIWCIIDGIMNKKSAF